MAADVIIKKEFVKRILHDTGHNITKEQAKRIRKYELFKTGYLIGSKTDATYKVISNDYSDGKLTLTYPIYERFLDMKKKKKAISKNKNKKRAFKIHNSVIMGNYNRMLYRLQNDFTEMVKQEIRQKLKQSYHER